MRVCELVGVPFNVGSRPNQRAYLHLLAVIKRTTLNGQLRGIVYDYLQRRSKDAQVEGTPTFGTKDQQLHEV